MFSMIEINSEGIQVEHVSFIAICDKDHKRETKAVEAGEVFHKYTTKINNLAQNRGN